MPVYFASQAVLDAISGFHIHRGVLAIGLKRQAETPEALLQSLPHQAIVVVLIGLSNHDNVGSIFRNAAAFGADAVLLDRSCCDPLYRKAIRVSVGAVLKVPFAIGEGAGALAAAVESQRFEPLALSPTGVEDISEAKRPDRLALFFGTEGAGLPADLLAGFRTVQIAMAPGFDSLNVAAASAIALHHFSRT